MSTVNVELFIESGINEGFKRASSSFMDRVEEQLQVDTAIQESGGDTYQYLASLIGDLDINQDND